MTIAGMQDPVGAPVPGFVRAMPRKALSRLLGHIGRLHAPRWLLQPILRAYVRHYRVDTAEMARPLTSYRSFLAFFTRALADGVRTADPDPRAILSPADGRVQWCGPLEASTLLQVKGIRYRVSDLLGDPAADAAFDGGHALVAYLSPGDYHRFHWPWTAILDTACHLPGDLWPVNEGAVAGVPGLFARNERVAVRGRLPGGAPVAFVPVGALNVGSIRMRGMPLTTNDPRHPRRRTVALDGMRATRFAECGCFEFGSSIVVLLGPGAGTFQSLAPGDVLRVGAAVGRHVSGRHVP